MDHEFAVKNHMAEQYMLGELNDTDRDAYEEHFFNCRACAEEVRSASEFVLGAREVFMEDRQVKAASEVVRGSRHGWMSWMAWSSFAFRAPALACALIVLAGFTVYQNVSTIPHWKQAAAIQWIPSEDEVVTLVHGRGAEDAQAGTRKDRPVRLKLALPDGSAGPFHVDIVTPSNITRLSLDVPVGNLTEPLQIRLSPGALAPGKYFVVIQGINSKSAESGVKGELARLPFELVQN